MDIKLTGRGFSYDIDLDGQDLATDASLRSAVILSLIINARADESEIPVGTNPQGWFAAPSGSKLWLLHREKITPSTPARAEQICREALQWMLDDGVAIEINVEARRCAFDAIEIIIQIVRATGAREVFTFSDLWAEIRGADNPLAPIHPTPNISTETFYILLENGMDRLITENGDNLIWR